MTRNNLETLRCRNFAVWTFFYIQYIQGLDFGFGTWKHLVVTILPFQTNHLFLPLKPFDQSSSVEFWFWLVLIWDVTTSCQINFKNDTPNDKLMESSETVDFNLKKKFSGKNVFSNVPNVYEEYLKMKILEKMMDIWAKNCLLCFCQPFIFDKKWLFCEKM